MGVVGGTAVRRQFTHLRRNLPRLAVILLAAVVALTAVLPYLISSQLDEVGVPAFKLAVESNDNTPISKKGYSRIVDEELPDYHLVFSTSCSAQQNWESYVFFYHCMRVRQRGTVTRITSGCSEKEAIELQKFHDRFIAPMSIRPLQQFFLHLTPDYSRIRLTEGKYAYKYMNKPYGLRHWMENHLKLSRKDSHSSTGISSPYSDAGQHKEHHNVLNGIVILMDPDMILLKPIGHDFSDEYQDWTERPSITKVTHGHPIAQQDGYLNSDWMNLNLTYITGNSSARPPPWSEGAIHWNTGPPYLATVADMFNIALLWSELAPRVLDVHPHLFAEMFGFIIATVTLELPFALTKSIVVSTTETSNREAWSLIDSLPDSDLCRIAVAATSDTRLAQTPVLPTGLHYCKRYMLGKSMFSKYRLKKNIMNCEKNLLRPPPFNLFPKFDYMISPPHADGKDMTTYKEVRQMISSKRAKREAFMICGMISALNEALRFYKQSACGKDGAPPANLNEQYSIHDDPTNY